MSEWTEEMAQQMRARAQLALSTALTMTDCMCAMCIKARTELLLLNDHDRLTAERNALLRAIYPNGHDAESIEGPVRTVVELQEANARLTAELDLERRLEAARPNLVQAVCETAAKNLHRANVAEAALADRDATNARLTAECEVERMRLAACMVAALGNTPAAAAQRIGLDNPYWSASYGDVCATVDREMALRDQVADRDATITRLREAVTAFMAKWDMAESHINSAITIASIHHCPYGGPTLIDELKALRALTPAKEADRG